MTETSDLSDSAFLIWEDADHETWWLARSHDGAATFVIAPDSITAHVLVLRQAEPDRKFKVIAAVPVADSSSVDKAVAEAKRIGVKWLGHPETPAIRNSVLRWRTQRWSFIALREVPLALTALCLGVVLAIIVSVFFITTDLAGWTMVVVGTALGTLFGWAMKWIADRQLASLTGDLGRFFTVTGSAAVGAAATVLIFFVLFAN